MNDAYQLSHNWVLGKKGYLFHINYSEADAMN